MAFITDDFLLHNKYAKILYHDYAKDLPIYDYHCHLPVRDILEDTQFRDASHLWLGGDHYKWRLLRAAGVPEQEITGESDAFTKFRHWANLVPYTIGNPIFHWTQLELKRYFGIDEILSRKNAEVIWNRMNEQISDPSFSARSLISRSNVHAVCTTDDPVDDLSPHLAIREDASFAPILAPAFRPDKAVKIEQSGFIDWVHSLSEASAMPISTFDDYLKALEMRIDVFHEAGCRIADFAMDQCLIFETTKESVDRCFSARLAGKAQTSFQAGEFQSYMVAWFGKEYAKREWTMQLHIGALRNTNSRMFDRLGPDTGFDAIHDGEVALPVARLLDSLEQEDLLPRSVLYCLNPKDNEVLTALMGCYQSSGINGKLQFGSGWWFNDQKDGMLNQMKSLANVGLLSSFVGMLTDSRSFISYPRHEYFRRILCQLIGSWVEQGEYPWDERFLGEVVADISFHNADRYFRLS